MAAVPHVKPHLLHLFLNPQGSAHCSSRAAYGRGWQRVLFLPVREKSHTQPEGKGAAHQGERGCIAAKANSRGEGKRQLKKRSRPGFPNVMPAGAMMPANC